MPTDSGDRRQVRTTPMPSPAPEAEHHLPCPRCDSTNTKFCYYNNYNLSQPRHFCKACRRYWTQGGTLRDVPVGGGSRSKSHSHSNKRSRTSAGSTPTSSSSSVSVSASAPTSAVPNVTMSGSDMMMPGTELEGFGSFSSLLASSCPGGVMALGGDPVMSRGGLGLGVGFGLGPGAWPMAGGDVGETGGGSTWQVAIGDAFNDGDCFNWPDLSISTPGNGCLP